MLKYITKFDKLLAPSMSEYGTRCITIVRKTTVVANEILKIPESLYTHLLQPRNRFTACMQHESNCSPYVDT